MKKFAKVLLAFDDEELRYALEQGADRIARLVQAVASVEELERIQLGQTDLLIIDADLAASPGTSATGSGIGSDWVVERHRRANPPPTIVYTENAGREQLRLSEFELCELLMQNPASLTKIVETFANKLRNTLANKQNAPSFAAIDVSVWDRRPVITVDSYVYTARGTPLLPPDQEVDAVDLDMLHALIGEFRDLGRRVSQTMKSRADWQRMRTRWEADYRQLGFKLYSWLAQSNFQKVVQRVNDNARLVGGAPPAKIALRLRVEREGYDACWEALCRDAAIPMGGGAGYLFQDQTIARQIAIPSPIANDKGGQNPSQIEVPAGIVNVLLIDSDLGKRRIAHGGDSALQAYLEDGDLARHLPRLRTADEIEGLRGLTAPSAAAAEISFDLLAMPSPAKTPFSLWREVEATLRAAYEKGRRYDVVHFAGHAIAWEENSVDARGAPIRRDCSYLLFAGGPANEAVPAAAFATVLGRYGVQLAYLSCCRGTAGKVAFEIAARGVPFAIGFTWDVNDGHATAFATSFYRKLLEYDLGVCAAYDETRRRMHANLVADPIWAWPVLIAQPAQWPVIQSCLRA